MILQNTTVEMNSDQFGQGFGIFNNGGVMILENVLLNNQGANNLSPKEILNANNGIIWLKGQIH